MESPPNSVNENPTKVVTIPVPIVHHNDETYYYVFVKGSLYSSDSAVFSCLAEEVQALSKKFQSPAKEIENGVMFKKPAMTVINSLAQLGYRVITSCGETETLWTLQREI